MRYASFKDDGWAVGEQVAVRGRAFDRKGARIDLQDAFEGVETAEEAVRVARRLDGFYAAVVASDDRLLLVCDHARSVPLYVHLGAQTRVADSVAAFADVSMDAFDDATAVAEFVLTRYVTGGETLRTDVHSVQAGEIVDVPLTDSTADSVHRYPYTRYRPTTDVESDPHDAHRRIGSVLTGVFDRVERVAAGRPVVVPLSGGWDSRLVATELVARGLDVRAFTFGVPGHADVEVSRDVATALDIPWTWVEYSPEAWHDWYHSEAYAAYHESAFNLDSLPFLAEWPAVFELQEEGWWPADALVCPGHTVATPSERVPAAWREATVSRQAVLDHIVDTAYTLWEWEDERFRTAFERRIRETVPLPPQMSGAEAAARYEQWQWATRMSVFTNGDTRLYDWFDCDWWLPLWDPAYVRFWATVPLSLRHGKRLQREYTRRRVAEVTGETALATRTADDWTPFDQLCRTVRTDPRAPFADGFDDWFGALAVPKSAWESWGRYPLGWYGVIPEAAADEFAAAPNLYSLRTLEAVGALSFEPPWVREPPLRRTLDVRKVVD